MRRFFGAVLGVLLACLIVPAARATTFKGEIVDSDLNCIQKPMKAPPDLQKNKEACILYWVYNHEPASKYVLYEPSSKTTYQLDNQVLVEPWAGAWVEVTGTESDKNIKVTAIKTDDEAYKNGKAPE